MTEIELKSIEERLQQTIRLLEVQTAALKQDLSLVSKTLAEKGEPTATEDVKRVEQLADELEKQAQQAKQALLENVGEVKEEAKTTPETPLKHFSEMASKWEKETLSMLERMQQKIYAKEVLGDLYNQFAKSPVVPPVAPSAEPPVERATVPPPPVSIPETDPLEEAKMEAKVREFKQKDALDDLKRKLGIKKD
jgi:hypothetical protein